MLLSHARKSADFSLAGKLPYTFDIADLIAFQISAIVLGPALEFSATQAWRGDIW